MDFRWQVSTRTLVQLVVVYVTTSAPRPSWVIVVPSSATLTGDNAVGRSTTSSTSVRAPELSQPTRIAWEGSKWVESTPVQPASPLKTQGLERLGVTDLWSAIRSGAAAVITVASSVTFSS